MASRAQSRLSRLLQNKQDTSGIFAFIFTSLLSHDVDVSMVIKTVISNPTPGQASPKMSLLSGCFKNRIKQASDLREVSLPCRHDQTGRLCQRSLRLPVNLLNKTSFLKSRKGFNASSALVSTAGAESFPHGERTDRPHSHNMSNCKSHSLRRLLTLRNTVLQVFLAK